MGDVADALGDVLGGVGDVIGDVLSGDINLDPYAKQKEEAEKEKQRDKKQKQAAKVQQELERKQQLRVKAANRDASTGSTIILGGEGKRKKASTVSSGMGLSKGDTGLQV